MLGPDGKPVTVTMGSYGIGVSRAVAAIAETTHDELGLCWPREVAPADVHVVVAGKPGAEQWPAAEQLAAELEAAGLRVLLDDRDGVSPGVKFNDAELLGIPTIVVVGRGVRRRPRSRSRTAAPATASTSLSPRSPTSSCIRALDAIGVLCARTRAPTLGRPRHSGVSCSAGGPGR